MRTDILRSVHEGVRVRMDQRGGKSPLELLIESLEEVILTFDGRDLVEGIGQNPLNVKPRFPFQPASDYQYDIQLMKSQLRALRQILAEITEDDDL